MSSSQQSGAAQSALNGRAPVARRKKPGIKPGGPNPGGFKPGHDPRRWTKGPTNPSKDSFEDKCRGYTDDALGFLVDLLQNEDAPVKERRMAAESLLSRGWGRAVDRIAIADMTPGQNGQAVDPKQIKRSTATELEMMLRQLAPPPDPYGSPYNGTGNGQVIDITPDAKSSTRHHDD